MQTGERIRRRRVNRPKGIVAVTSLPAFAPRRGRMTLCVLAATAIHLIAIFSVDLPRGAPPEARGVIELKLAAVPIPPDAAVEVPDRAEPATEPPPDAPPAPFPTSPPPPVLVEQRESDQGGATRHASRCPGRQDLVGPRPGNRIPGRRRTRGGRQSHTPTQQYADRQHGTRLLRRILAAQDRTHRQDQLPGRGPRQGL